VTTQDAVAPVPASSTKTAYVGVANIGMEKKCVFPSLKKPFLGKINPLKNRILRIAKSAAV
jgi:hypothetical protein